MQPAVVGDAAAALDALYQAVARGQPYSLVLLDARMPEVDGLTLAGQIRQQPELSATRIIMLTSGDRPGDLARLRELRVDAHLLKPIQQDELLETICQVMSPANGNVSPAVRPAGSGNRPGAAGYSRSGSAGKPLRVLVAEDDEFNAQLLEKVLGRQGHGVRFADNGREALALAEEGAFDLLLLDIHMPELDGFQVAQAIRERERTVGGHLPIIALTARSRKEDRERCLAAGMDDFLTKPVRPGELWTAIERVLEACLPSGPAAPRAPFTHGRLDAPMLLAACGGDAALLAEMCQHFQAQIPEQLAAIRNALRDSDAPRLRELAHKCCSRLATFSAVLGDLAGQLEDLAIGAELEKAPPILQQLETGVSKLLEQVGGLSIEQLQDQTGVPRDGNGTRRP